MGGPRELLCDLLPSVIPVNFGAMGCRGRVAGRVSAVAVSLSLTPAPHSGGTCNCILTGTTSEEQLLLGPNTIASRLSKGANNLHLGLVSLLFNPDSHAALVFDRIVVVH